MQIKTLSEILAEMGGQSVSADTNNPQTQTSTTIKHRPKQQSPQSNHDTRTVAHTTKPTTTKSPTAHPKQSHKKPANPPNSQVAPLLAQHQKDPEQKALPQNLADALQGVAIEPLAQTDRAINYMRWLAFYYLSKRELSQHELRQKLLAKDCDADAVEMLLIEFAEKGYQSDERCAYMIIRESIRKARGKQYIHQAFKEARLNFDSSLDDMIAQAGIDTLTDGTALDSCHDKIDWLYLAVEARCKKYGNAPPQTPKEKAKQLRFLQYRGYEMSVCFDALKYTLDDLKDR